VTHAHLSGEPVVALDARLALGESPVWDERTGCLYVADILDGDVLRFDPRTGDAPTVAHAEGTVGAVALTDGDGLLLAAGMQLVLDGSVVAEIDDASGVRFNDGAVDAAGRFWVGTMALDGSPEGGTLYRSDRDGMTATLSPVSISNGIDWSLDGTTMYYVDTTAQRIDAFAFDAATGSISERRTFAEIDPVDGSPDGLAVDAEGYVWLALWDGWALRRYRPDGTLERVVDLPVSLVTSCAFGGDDLGDLYVTTASVGLSDAELRAQPHAGAVFACRPGVTGRPPNRFRGPASLRA
jgi:sugar lactone lactonase YvrE